MAIAATLNVFCVENVNNIYTVLAGQKKGEGRGNNILKRSNLFIINPLSREDVILV